ncbi:Glycolipid transfer protein [Dioscorea alata]|uniref:Glycolipid transfer protein n=2 Tax=Dioscorea alata TaxID=55571 RepID=A0ACB7UYN8_DIOAL|nr:Glycolipid transfer protein [Dioscorea alata]KAH7665844.1 Glycolipid transfer protein [Dioscorea alata]
MEHVKSDGGEILTRRFLDVCKHVLPVLDKFGAALALIKSDIERNILRLDAKYNSDPSKFDLLYNIVKAEVETGTAEASSSCSNALLWLTRALDFIVELFHNLLEHPDWTMTQACTDSYGKTLKKWHGWIANTAFMMTMKLAPDRKKFLEVIGGLDDPNADMEKFCATFGSLLRQNHKFLDSIGLDDLKIF